MEDLLTIKQVSILLKVHQLTVRRYINEGKLKAIKVGGNVRVTQADLRSFSESYIAHSKVSKSSSDSGKEPFAPNDPFFRLRGRGLSLDRFDDKR
jgi:excisionase family DNA binding protein